MKKFISVLALLLGVTLAQAQVRQSGTVTQRHAACWTSSGVIQDCGTAAIPFLSSIGTIGQGPTICANSAANTGPYNQLCLSAYTAANAKITLQSYGGAADQGLDLCVNGSCTALPSNPGANFLTGTGPFSATGIASFQNTSGVIIDSGVKAAGGVITSGTWGGSNILIAAGGTGANTASGARTNLGLGTIATQDSSSVAITGGAITGMPAPTVSADVATKAYVDATSTGLNIHAAVNLTTAAVLPNTPTYANGASGVGATLTAGANAALVVDSVTVTSAQRVLAKNQASTFQNGVYSVTTVGNGSTPWVLTRATDFDTAAEMTAGSYFTTLAGTVNAGNAYVLATTVATVGTDAVTFNQFSSQGTSINGVSGALTTGSGLTITSTKLNIPGIVSVTDATYGAVCDGVTDDTTAVQNAINSGAAIVLFPQGTCIIGAAGLTGASNQIWRGQGATSSIIKLGTNPSGEFVTFNSKTGFELTDLTLDWNNRTASGQNAILSLITCTDFAIRKVRLIKGTKFGIAGRNMQRFTIEDSYIQRDSIIATENQAIHTDSIVGENSYGKIINNHFINWANNFGGMKYTIVANNIVNGYAYGAGFGQGATGLPDTAMVYSNNMVINGSNVLDSNLLRPPAFEIYVPNTILNANLATANGGGGIRSAGVNSIVTSNAMYNNGNYNSVDPLSIFSGIEIAYIDPTTSGLRNVVGSNIAYGNKTIGFQTSGNSGTPTNPEYVTATGNFFTGSGSAVLATDGRFKTFVGPALESSVVVDPSSMANNTGFSTTLSAAGAALGDKVSVSFSLDLQGIQLQGWVSTANLVTVRFYNNTGGTIDLASGTLQASIWKSTTAAPF